MAGKIAVVAGSTGLIGSQLLKLLLKDEYYSKVIALSRKPLIFTDAKLENVVIPSNDLSTLSNIQANDIFCCLGTTIRQAGTKEAFRKIDFEYPLELARKLKVNGARSYHLVSALGADKKSSIFYNKVKGEVEAAIEEQQFQSYHIYRPSLLLGDRKEQRAGEDAAKVFYKIFGFLIPKKYQAIDSAKVANVMLNMAKENKQGQFIHESAEMQSI